MLFKEGDLVEVIKTVKTISGFPDIQVGTCGRLGRFQRTEGNYQVFQFYPLDKDRETVLPGAYSVVAGVHVETAHAIIKNI